MFSKACEYAIRAIIHIAQQSNKGNRVSLKEVAEAIDSPVAFTAKILQSLAQNQLIVSVKGAAGGYEFPPQKQYLDLYRIVQIIDGEQILTKCGLGLKECNAQKPCPMHHQFMPIRNHLQEILKTTITDLAHEMNGKITFLKG